MKRSFVFSLLVILSCFSAFAGSEKNKYKVNALGGTTKAGIGDTLELNLTQDSILVLDETCAVRINEKKGKQECANHPKDAPTAQFPLSAITEVEVVGISHFVCINWATDGQKATLIIEPNMKDFPLIIGFFEEVAKKKPINVKIQSTDRPRVFLHSQSSGNNRNAWRDQSMEMASDFGSVCPTVQITINDQKADFTVALNHIEMGLAVRDNQVQVYNKDGDLITGSEGGSIMDGVKGACALIITQWAFNQQ
jgi:hypothetical protein